MKKNKKIILIILAIILLIIMIIVGKQIITDKINESKTNNFEKDVQKALVYLEQQAKLLKEDASKVDKEFKNNKLDNRYSHTTDNPNIEKIYSKLGLKKENVRAISYVMKSDGTACIKVLAIPKDSEYYTDEYWEIITEGGEKTKGYYKAKPNIKYTLGKGC